MPEGDSYTRAAALARRVLEGATIVAVDGVPAIRRHADRVVGHDVSEIRTAGKHLLFDLASGWTIHVWLGMPGRVTVVGASGRRSQVGESPPAAGRRDRMGGIRLRLEAESGTVTVHAAPKVEIERRRVIDAALASLGPDVLAEQFDWSDFSNRAKRVDPGRPAAEVLIDQRVLSGIGNEYKSEILFLERMHPLTSWGLLDDAEIQGLARRAIALMRPNATRARRITTGAASGSHDGDRWVYDRAGTPCRRCRTPIRAGDHGSPPRRTYRCPLCQPSKAPMR